MSLLRKILVAALTTLLATAAHAGPCSLTCQQKVDRLHLVCGKHSSPINAGTPIPVKESNYWSLLACAGFCYWRQNCQTIYWDSGECYLYDNAPSDMIFTGTSPGQWYDVDCFKCEELTNCWPEGQCAQQR
ncbi:hypothetical protein EDB81DRAFT_797859 [Dactylonectria macrodidyma]|uniref:Apple domain-containing protein n=1 Tax=Dactylonectria macrodidyma TaxID=307937 RepID=A0A9P9J5P2_9HYPO|nr:hypothetical protein EDB81DRAFT_797859 [Dactylonectria macrodidyma]